MLPNGRWLPKRPAVGQKLAVRFPSLSLGGSFGWQAYSFGALGGSDTVLRALSGTLAATLFDGGKLRSAVDIQSAVQEQALLSYEASVLSALEEVENGLTAYAASRERGRRPPGGGDGGPQCGGIEPRSLPGRAGRFPESAGNRAHPAGRPKTTWRPLKPPC